MLCISDLTKEFAFDTLPDDNIKEVIITSMTFVSYDKESIKKIIVPLGSKETIVDKIQKEDVLSQCYFVFEVDLTFCFEPKKMGYTGRIITATLSHPNECHIRSCTDEENKTIHRCIKRWGLMDNHINDVEPPLSILNYAAIYLACKLCDSSSRRVTGSVLPILGQAAKTLLHLGAFSDGFKASYRSIYANGCLNHLTPDPNGNPGYINKHLNTRVNVAQDELIQYRFDMNWFINRICLDLDIPTTSPPEMLADDCLWYLGKISLGDSSDVPVFFARCLSERSQLQQCYTVLQEHSGFKNGIILTSSDAPPQGSCFPSKHVVISLRNSHIYDSKQFRLDRHYLANHLGLTISNTDYHSTDYRYVRSGGKEYFFSKTQARAVGVLYENEGKMHKDSLLRAINSTQTDAREIFRPGGKPHPALGKFIKFEKGFCYLVRNKVK